MKKNRKMPPVYICNNCGSHFRQTHINQLYVEHNLCPFCFSREGNKKICKICTKSFFDDGEKYNRTDKCKNCQRKKKTNCIECKKQYIAEISKYSYNSSEYRCDNCEGRRGRIISGSAQPEDAKEGFKLRVKYHTETRTHSGYCSDQGESENESEEEILELPLWKGVTNSDIDSSGKVTNLCVIGKYYDKETNSHSGSCYCGGFQKTWTVKKAKIIKDERLIDLDE